MIDVSEKGLALFGVLQVHPEAWISEELVTPLTAFHAARTARKLYKSGANLPYVRIEEDRPDIVNIAWWNSNQRPRPSVHDFPYHLEKMQSFKLCVDRLLQFAGIDSPDWVSLLKDTRGLRDYHTDEFDGGRSLLLLEGVKEITFIHPFAPIRTVFTQTPGDAYQMDFRPHQLSIMHAVNNVMDSNISLYVNTYNG